MVRQVIAHWHFFNHSINDQAFPDYWENGYLAPGGESNAHIAYGGLVRDRPLYRPKLGGPTAHWKFQDFRYDAATAKKMRIDAFQYNCMDVVTNGETDLILDACEEFGLEMLLSVDVAADVDDADVIAYFNAHRSHSAAMRRGGVLMVGAYRPEVLGVSRWTTILAGIGEPVFFIPTFLDPSAYDDFVGILDGATRWDGGNYATYEAGGGIPSLEADCIADGVVFGCPVVPQDHRPRSQIYWEARGSRTARVGWEYAVNSSAEYVFMHTWNDYAEGHHWKPSLRTQYAYADLARYYAKWFKDQTQPTIRKDVLYYFHRIERTDAEGTGALQSAGRFANQVAETFNEIELTGFLTAPGTLVIDDTSAEVGAGIQTLRAPWAAGRPRFKLIRDGREVIDFSSNFTCRETSDYQDLQYRGGSSSRRPVSVP